MAAKRKAKNPTKAASKPAPAPAKNPRHKPGKKARHSAAVVLARSNGRTRRANPVHDAEAVREYARVHWGERGNERVSLVRVPDPRSATLVELGQLIELTYRTEKRGDGLSDYVHRFKLKGCPVLAFNKTGLIIVGGEYDVTTRGIEG